MWPICALREIAFVPGTVLEIKKVFAGAKVTDMKPSGDNAQMTQSPFKDKPDIRKYSVIPARAIQDDELHWTSLRVLGALCLHTNAYGICWPSRVTIARHISRSTKTVSVHVKRLMDKGYVRKLQPKAYPFKGKSNWRTNRYQVMFDGPQTELPSKEQFYAPRPKVAVDDPTEEAVAVTIKKGSGGENVAFSSLSQAFCLGVEGCLAVIVWHLHRLRQPSVWPCAA